MGAHAEIEASDAGDYNELGKQKDILPMGCDALHRLASAFYETDLPLELFVGRASAYSGRRTSKSASSSSEANAATSSSSTCRPTPASGTTYSPRRA